MGKRQTDEPAKNGRPPELVGLARDRFLAVLAITGLIGPSAKAAGVSRQTVHTHRKQDPDFNTLVENALEDYADAVEAEIHRRAIEGVEKPVFWKGKRVDNREVREYSDQLLLAMAKRRRPEYRDGPVANVSVNLGTMQMPEALEDHYRRRQELLRQLDARPVEAEVTTVPAKPNGNGSGE